MDAPQVRVIVRRWAFGVLKVEVEVDGEKSGFARRFRADRRAKAFGHAVGLAFAFGGTLHDATGVYSDAECAELVAAFREAGKCPAR